ncbi:MAG: hypothetical protein ACUVUU_09865 [bacterium]
MKKAKKISKGLVLVLTCSLFLAVQSRAAGRSVNCYSPTVIDMGDGTANIGLIADRTRPSNMSLNPAILAGRAPVSVSFAYGRYLVTSRTVMISFRGRVGDVGFGIHSSHFNGGVISRTTGDDPAGQASGSFSYGETSIGFGLGAQLVSWLALGGGLRIARVDVDDYTKARAFFDAGTIVKLNEMLSGKTPKWELNVGMVVRGIEVSKGSKCQDEKIGKEISMNVSMPEKGVTFALGWLSSTKGRSEIRGGMVLRPAGDFELILGSRRRIGSFGDVNQGFPWHRGLTGGFGLRFGSHWLNYSYEDASPLEGTHRFMLRTRIGN